MAKQAEALGMLQIFDSKIASIPTHVVFQVTSTLTLLLQCPIRTKDNVCDSELVCIIIHAAWLTVTWLKCYSVSVVGRRTPKCAAQTAADSGSSCCTASGHCCCAGNCQGCTGTSAAMEIPERSEANMLHALLASLLANSKNSHCDFGLCDLLLIKMPLILFRKRRWWRKRLVPRGRRRHRGIGPWQVSGVCSHGAAGFHSRPAYTTAKYPRKRVAQPCAAQASTTPRGECAPCGKHSLYPGRTTFTLLSCWWGLRHKKAHKILLLIDSWFILF